MHEPLEFILSDTAKAGVFERGGSFAQRNLMDWLWNELKKRCPQAEIRPKDRYVGLYLNSSNKTFAKIDSQVKGPIFGIPDRVAQAFEFHHLTPEHFADWGGKQKRFTVDDNSIAELLELLILSYQYNKDGYHRLSEYRARCLEITRIEQEDSIAISDQDLRPEGGKKTRQAIASERDPRLRALAIKYHRLKCMACKFDFEAVYGERGKDFIEVHHNKPLGERAKPELTDYRTDLDVVCSNCHRMIHRKKDSLLTVQELREIIEEARKSLRRARRSSK
ncbi:MAG: HNH endonuclease [Bythopirellula sp.]|nr:HNH endonuclease [Bythopirellula sp.]